MFDKYESRRIRVEIRRVLLDVWDPIGVRDEPNAQDDSDCCLGSLFHLLTTGGTDDKIAEYLWRQGTEHMGLSLQKEAMTPTVSALPTNCAARKLRLIRWRILDTAVGRVPHGPLQKSRFLDTPSPLGGYGRLGMTREGAVVESHPSRKERD